MDDIIPILFLVITFLSWIFSQFKEKKDKKDKPRRPAQRQNELSNEIENFLEEITGNKPKKKREIPKPVVVKKSKPKKTITKTRQPIAKVKKRTPVTQKQKTFETNISQQHLEKKNFGSKLDQHVSSYMDRDVKDHVEEHLTHDINQSVSSHLGKLSKDMSAQGSNRNQAHPIIELFHDRNSVAKAIMLNEILSPPLSQRNKNC